MAKGPVLIDLEGAEAPQSVADAPAVPDLEPGSSDGRAMQQVATVVARRRAPLLRWLLGLGVALVTGYASVAAWDFGVALVARNAILGWVFGGVLAAFLLVLAAVLFRELAALGRLRRVDGLRRSAVEAREAADLKAARAVSDRLVALYAGREEARWGRGRLAELAPDQLDAESLLSVTEAELLAPFDALAQREVEAAARQVAAVTALVPLALADVAAALVANTRMIRRIADVYGGRSGAVGSWRLTRAVFSHMLATGAVAVGDDLLEPVLGGTVLAKVSRRFGEGLVNGALTARVGVAAMEVCRPMPFSDTRKPRVRAIIKRSLTGLFSSGPT